MAEYCKQVDPQGTQQGMKMNPSRHEQKHGIEGPGCALDVIQQGLEHLLLIVSVLLVYAVGGRVFPLLQTRVALQPQQITFCGLRCSQTYCANALKGNMTLFGVVCVSVCV